MDLHGTVGGVVVFPRLVSSHSRNLLHEQNRCAGVGERRHTPSERLAKRGVASINFLTHCEENVVLLRDCDTLVDAQMICQVFKLADCSFQHQNRSSSHARL